MYAMQARFHSLEKYLESASHALETVARKEAGIRDAFDDLARANYELMTQPYAFNSSAKSVLETFSKQLVSAQDYRQAKLGHIENKLIPQINKLSLESKQVKGLKTKLNVSGSEQKLSSSAGSESLKAAKTSGSLDALTQNKRHESELIAFERKKLQQIKKILGETIVLELAFHSRAIEQLSPLLSTLNEMDVEADVEEFCKAGLGISSGGPGSLRNDPLRSSTGSASLKPANTGGPPPLPTLAASSPTDKTKKLAKQDQIPTKVETSFNDDDEEGEYEDEEEEDYTDTSGYPGTWNPTDHTAARQSRPLTGAKGPPVPERPSPSGQKMPNPNLFLGATK